MRPAYALLLLALAAVAVSPSSAGTHLRTGARHLNQLKFPFSLPPLRFPTTDYEPSLDNMTMVFHHTRHHQAAITALNNALNTTDGASIRNHNLGWLMANVNRPIIPRSIQDAIRNSGGSHWNHALFWETLASGSAANATKPSAKLQAAIDQSWGSLANMKSVMVNESSARFGSGWVWLGPSTQHPFDLVIRSTPNQDNPTMPAFVLRDPSISMIPIFGIDVWEHAYYLRYQNLRTTYASAIFSNVDWDVVSFNYADAVKMLQDKYNSGCQKKN